MNMQPWWVICLGGDDCAREIEAILKGWTTWAQSSSDDAHRWWCLDCVNESDGDILRSIHDFLRHNTSNMLEGNAEGQARIPSYQSLDISFVNIAVLGNICAPETRSFFHLIPQVIRKKRHPLFPHATVKILGMLYIPQNFPNLDQPVRDEGLCFLTELHSLMSQGTLAHRPFDAVFFFQDRNFDAENQNGYRDLSDREIYQSMAQVILHLSIAPSPWLENTLTHQAQFPYVAAGSAAIFYDSKHHIATLAHELAGALLQNFKESNTPPWVDANTVEVILVAGQLKERLSIIAIANQIKTKIKIVDYPSRIWEYPKGAGPWNFLKRELLYSYFGNYVKNLPVRLVEYGRIFLTRNFQDLHRACQDGKQLAIKGDHAAIGLAELIASASRSLWADQRPACGLKQYENILNRIKDEIRSQRQALNAPLARIEELENFNVFYIPAYMQEFYSKAKDEFDIEEEKNLVQKLTNILESHPLPLALFSRAFLIGIVLVFVGHPVIEAISPWLINLEGLLAIPGLVPLLLFVIPVLVALWRYTVQTLRAIRKLILQYIANLLKHAQHRARQVLKETIDEVYDELSKHCDTLLEQANRIRDQFAYPDIVPQSMIVTKFQQPFDGTFENEPILREKPRYMIHGLGKYLEDLDASQLASLMREALVSHQEAHTPLWMLLLQGDFENAGKRLKGFCESKYSGVARSLHRWLQESGNPVAVRRMSDLAYPPVIVPQGRPREPLVSESKSHENIALSPVDQFQLTTVEHENLVSITRGRRLTNPADINLGNYTTEVLSQIVNSLSKANRRRILSLVFLLTESSPLKTFEGSNISFEVDNNLLQELTQQLNLYEIDV